MNKFNTLTLAFLPVGFITKENMKMLLPQKLSLVFLLFTCTTSANANEDKFYAVEKNEPGLSFIFPVPQVFEIATIDPLLERLSQRSSVSVRVPRSVEPPPSLAERTNELLIGGGETPFQMNELDIGTLPPPNLRVSFELREMENVVVSGDGVDIESWASWYLRSETATIERNAEAVNLPVPGPGETWPVTHYNLIYDAIVLDGCNATPVFPIEMYSSVFELEGIFSEQVVVGEVDLMDNTTIQPTGVWNFNYTIYVTGTNGDVSHFKFSGTVTATCTNLDFFYS